MWGLLVLGEKFPCSPKDLQLLPLLTKGQSILLSCPLVTSLPPLMFPKPALRASLSRLPRASIILLLICSQQDCFSEAGRSLHIRLAPASRSCSFKPGWGGALPLPFPGLGWAWPRPEAWVHLPTGTLVLQPVFSTNLPLPYTSSSESYLCNHQLEQLSGVEHGLLQLPQSVLSRAPDG